MRRTRERARNQRELLRITLASIGDAVITTDMQGRVDYLNGVAESLTGWRQAEAVGRPLEEVFAIRNEETRAPVESPAQRALREGVVVGLANHTVLIARDGRERPIDDSAAPIRDEQGEIVGCVLIFRDVTERRRSEQAMARSERELTDLFANASVGMHFVGPDGVILRANQAELDLLGYPEEEYVGRHIADFHVDRPVIDDILARLSRGETLREHPARMRCRDGSVRDVLINSNVLFLEGRFIHTRCFTRDVTQQNRAERALQASEERFRGIFKNAGVSLWEVDFSGVKAALEELRAQGVADLARHLQAHPETALRIAAANRVLDVNDATVRMFEAGDKRELLGSVPELLILESLDAVVGELVAVAEGRPYFEAEALVRTLRKNPLHVLFTMVLPSPGQPYDRVLFSVIDISSRKRAEDLLKEADQRKDQFLATLAHELRNPLAPVRNSLEIMKRAGGDAGLLQRARETMDRQVAQMERLIDDLLDISRITHNALQLRVQRVALDSVVQHAVEACRPLADLSRHELAITLPPEPIHLSGDPVRLAQILGNLLNNACKYTSSGGRISLTAERDGGEVVVSVRDNGIGISPEMLPRIFDMFTQVDRSLERTHGGLGIGLTLVKQLVELHHGRVEAFSEQGRGTEIRVRLPIMAAEPPSPRPAPSLDALPKTPYRVLVVDDNRDSAESLGTLLRLVGQETLLAYDGLEALEAVERFRPDLVLLDIGLPKLNGFDVCRRLRAGPSGQDLRIVAMTGWGEDNDRRKSVEAGLDGHMVKPVEFTAILQLLSSLPAPEPR